jgi:hypothetical protein
MDNTTGAGAALLGLDERLLTMEHEDGLVREVQRLIARVRWSGMVLRAPKIVDIESAKALRIVAAIAQSAERGSEVVPGDNAVVIVTGLDVFFASSAALFPKPEGRTPMPKSSVTRAEESSDQARLIRSISIGHIDLKALELLPWQAGRYAVRLVAYDWISPVAILRLQGLAADEVKATKLIPVVDTREETLASWAGRGRGEANALPNFNKLPVSPDLTTEGVALRLPTHPVAATAAAPFAGTVRMSGVGLSRRAAGTPSAIVHGSLILARRGIVYPIIIDVPVPLFAEGSATESSPFNGYFAFDLKRLAGKPLPAGEYQVYFLVAGHSSGPHSLQLE